MKKRGFTTCRKCKTQLPRDNFIVNNKTRDACISCRNDREKKREKNSPLWLSKKLTKCKSCEIILSDEVCACGKQHGLPSRKTPTICHNCQTRKQRQPRPLTSQSKSAILKTRIWKKNLKKWTYCAIEKRNMFVATATVTMIAAFIFFMEIYLANVPILVIVM